VGRSNSLVFNASGSELAWCGLRLEGKMPWFNFYSIACFLFIAFSGEKEKSKPLQFLSCSSFFFMTWHCLKKKKVK